jgi:hypothetical protein
MLLHLYSSLRNTISHAVDRSQPMSCSASHRHWPIAAKSHNYKPPPFKFALHLRYSTALTSPIFSSMAAGAWLPADAATRTALRSRWRLLPCTASGGPRTGRGQRCGSGRAVQHASGFLAPARRRRPPGWYPQMRALGYSPAGPGREGRRGARGRGARRRHGCPWVMRIPAAPHRADRQSPTLICNSSARRHPARSSQKISGGVWLAATA